MKEKDQEMAIAISSMAVKKDIEYIKIDINEIKETLKMMTSSFVTRTEFMPVKTIVYSLVGLIMTGFIVYLLNLAFK